jgi:hypothetical protein
MNWITWLLFIGSVVVLPGSALLALRWAVRHGQLQHLQKGALLIFDEDEPVGQFTDHFPGPASAVGTRPTSQPRTAATTDSPA